MILMVKLRPVEHCCTIDASVIDVWYRSGVNGICIMALCVYDYGTWLQESGNRRPCTLVASRRSSRYGGGWRLKAHF